MFKHSSKTQARRLTTLLILDIHDAACWMSQDRLSLTSRTHTLCWWEENNPCKVFKFSVPKSEGVLSEAVMHGNPCRLCVCVERILSVCQSLVVARGLLSTVGDWRAQRRRLDGRDAALQRHQFRGQHRLFKGTVCVSVSVCLCLLMHKCLCVSMRTCLHAPGGVKMDPSGQAFPGRVPVDGEGAEGRVGGRWGSLLMKSHLRPPFTLNMGHCSCPDLGFDPQRCLTPTSPPQNYPPPHHLERTHAYVYIHARSHTHRYIMHVHDDSVYTYAFAGLALDCAGGGSASHSFSF